jgi:phage host-nuclease inhibitor protein Gam
MNERELDQWVADAEHQEVHALDASQSHQDARRDASAPEDGSDTNYTPGQWKIDSEESANWYLRKLANIETERDRIRHQYNAMMQDLDRNGENLRSRHQADLEHWAKSQLKGKARNIKLLQGTISFKMVPASVKVADKEAAATHAYLAGWKGCYHTFVQIRADEYKQKFIETGEMLPGIEVAPEHESVSITFGKKE